MLIARQEILTVIVLMALTGLLAGPPAGAAEAAKQKVAQPVVPALSGLKARVGQGGKVDLAASRLTPAELAALRPNFAALKPRARTNTE